MYRAERMGEFVALSELVEVRRKSGVREQWPFYGPILRAVSRERIRSIIHHQGTLKVEAVRSSKIRYICTTLHGITAQKIADFIMTSRESLTQ
jgi:hypothetical protein